MATNHQNSNTVCVTKSVSVYPKTLVPPKVVSLSNLDRQCPMLMYLVFFYKTHSLPLDYVFKSLKSGLEETLSVWYPAAGRLIMNPSDGKLNLWCNNEGAILVEAITRVKISELGDLSHYNDFFEDLVYKPVFNRSFSDMPLVVAQVTKFGCGGYSIGIGTSHSLFDGPSTYDFLRAWACNSAMLKQKQVGSHEVTLHQLPVHERGTLLLVGNNCEAQKEVLAVKRAAAIDHLYELIKQALSCDHQPRKVPAGADHLMKHGGNSNDYVLRTYHLSGAMIDKLKLKTLAGHRRGIISSCSSFEIVAAHLWKARTKALGVKKEKMVCLQFAVDIRNKMAPALPKGFSGNAYVLASIMLTAAELEQQNHEGIIEKIKEAKSRVSNEYVKAYIEALDGANQQGSLPPMKELTIVSDWTRMPFHKIDFLSGEATAAAAAYASPLVSPIPQVAYLMQSVDDTRGIHVRIGLHPQSLNAFSHYFLTNLQ